MFDLTAVFICQNKKLCSAGSLLCGHAARKWRGWGWDAGLSAFGARAFWNPLSPVGASLERPGLASSSNHSSQEGISRWLLVLGQEEAGITREENPLSSRPSSNLIKTAIPLHYFPQLGTQTHCPRVGANYKTESAELTVITPWQVAEMSTNSFYPFVFTSLCNVTLWFLPSKDRIDFLPPEPGLAHGICFGSQDISKCDTAGG